MTMALVGTPVVRFGSSLASTCSNETCTFHLRGSRFGASTAGLSGGALRNSRDFLTRKANFSKRVERRDVAAAAIFDPHSLAFLADLFDPELDPTKLPLNLDITNAIVEEKSTWALSEGAIKDFYMGCAFVFCWGCCVFGSMNDKFYESDMYRDAGGNGTGHWI